MSITELTQGTAGAVPGPEEPHAHQRSQLPLFTPVWGCRWRSRVFLTARPKGKSQCHLHKLPSDLLPPALDADSKTGLEACSPDLSVQPSALSWMSSSSFLIHLRSSQTQTFTEPPVSRWPSLPSALSLCQQEDRGPKCQACPFSPSSTPSWKQGQKGQGSGQPSDLGLGTLLPRTARVQGLGIMNVFTACKLNYQCLKNRSGDRGGKKNSNHGAGVGDLASSPHSAHTCSAVSVGRRESGGLRPAVPPVA